MPFRFMFGCLVCAALAASAASQTAAPIRRPDGDLGQLATETKHLTVSVSSRPASAARGARVVLVVDVVPKPKMHVYAPDQEEYIPISLTLTPDKSFRAQAPRYPAAEQFFFEPLHETQRVYSKPFRITQPVTVTVPPAVGILTITGTIRYQACDDAVCYVPQTVPVRWNVMVNR